MKRKPHNDWLGYINYERGATIETRGGNGNLERCNTKVIDEIVE
jgi:hypothetical protein